MNLSESLIEAFETLTAPRCGGRGSRNTWPACGARLRGERAGRTCRAAGCGFGGRCILHGGVRVGAPWRGQAKASPRPLRKFVLVTVGLDSVGELLDSDRNKRRWQSHAIPLDLAERIPLATLMRGVSPGTLARNLVRAGVRHDIASKWPQPLGYRIVLRLAERGKIAFALLVAARDIKRAGRARVGELNTRASRIGPDELLAALRAAGRRIPRAKSSTSKESEEQR